MSFAACNLCHRGTREEFTAKVDGKEYVRCKNKLCGFFCPVGKFEEYEDLVQHDVGEFYKGVDAPKCYHNQPTILKISNEPYMLPSNRGRPYFVCASQARCKFFTWSDIETEPVQMDEEKVNALWVRSLNEKRLLIKDMKKQHHVVIGELVKRINSWRDRFSDLLEEFVLCEYCNKHKNEAYQSGDDDRAKAWYPTNCDLCKVYTRFF